MDLTGEELYDHYRGELKERGVCIDSWEELDSVDRSAWDALAGRLAGWIAVASGHEK